ncbi:MAG: hypothetical protein Q9225_007360 [Loekoesia sp. 1 TL-2023]
MPRRSRGPSLPSLDSSVPIAPALVTLSTATAPSPSSTSTLVEASAPIANGIPQRSGSKRLERVKELLTPIKGASASPVAGSTSEVARETIMEEMVEGDATSGIQFFERHPLDSRNPLTFLDGGSGSGGGEGGVDKKKDNSNGQGKALDKVSPASFDLPASPPRDIPRTRARAPSPVIEPHDALAGFERLDLQAQRRTPWAPANGQPRRTRSQANREVMPVRARPVALYEMPGRYRSVETCWHCADGTLGKKCRVCGLVVRRNSDEKY